MQRHWPPKSMVMANGCSQLLFFSLFTWNSSSCTLTGDSIATGGKEDALAHSARVRMAQDPAHGYPGRGNLAQSDIHCCARIIGCAHRCVR